MPRDEDPDQTEVWRGPHGGPQGRSPYDPDPDRTEAWGGPPPGGAPPPGPPVSQDRWQPPVQSYGSAYVETGGAAPDPNPYQYPTQQPQSYPAPAAGPPPGPYVSRGGWESSGGPRSDPRPGFWRRLWRALGG